jgi:hypothetical protein
MMVEDSVGLSLAVAVLGILLVSLGSRRQR